MINMFCFFVFSFPNTHFQSCCLLRKNNFFCCFFPSFQIARFIIKIKIQSFTICICYTCVYSSAVFTYRREITYPILQWMQFCRYVVTSHMVWINVLILNQQQNFHLNDIVWHVELVKLHTNIWKMSVI